MSPIQFAAVLYDVRTKRDGGGRIQLDFGVDALPAILELQKLNAAGDISLALAVVPYRNQQDSVQNHERVDEHGEIVMDY
jgi:hypothetical protein